MYTSMRYPTEPRCGAWRGTAQDDPAGYSGHRRTRYLNFMGNEFGHPNGGFRGRKQLVISLRATQWRLRDDAGLKFRFLADFDKAMIALLVDTNS